MKRIPRKYVCQGQNEFHSKLSSDFEIEDLAKKNLLKLQIFCLNLFWQLQIGGWQKNFLAICKNLEVLWYEILLKDNNFLDSKGEKIFRGDIIEKVLKSRKFAEITLFLKT